MPAPRELLVCPFCGTNDHLHTIETVTMIRRATAARSDVLGAPHVVEYVPGHQPRQLGDTHDTDDWWCSTCQVEISDGSLIPPPRRRTTLLLRDSSGHTATVIRSGIGYVITINPPSPSAHQSWVLTRDGLKELLTVGQTRIIGRVAP